MNKTGHRTEPCGTPNTREVDFERWLLRVTVFESYRRDKIQPMAQLYRKYRKKGSRSREQNLVS